MRHCVLFLVTLPFSALGQSGTCSDAYEALVEPGRQLSMHIRSGEIEIRGVEGGKLRVKCDVQDSDEARRVKIDFHGGELRVQGGRDHNHFSLRIEVPKQSNLVVRVPAGELRISGVSGDKDVELHAGNLTISVGKAADYAHAEASVTAGDLTASAFGVVKDGLFRSFSRENPGGKYRLHAQVWAGNVTLQ
jgi:hypothetical protein